MNYRLDPRTRGSRRRCLTRPMADLPPRSHTVTVRLQPRGALPEGVIFFSRERGEWWVLSR